MELGSGIATYQRLGAGLLLSNTSFPPVLIDGAIHLPIEQ